MSLEALADGLRDALKAIHLRAAQNAIAGVDANGGFTDPASLRRVARPLVLDANWLHDDVGRACRGTQTIMLTAANQGLVRLYCAPHVLDEVAEHHVRWAQRKGIAPVDFLDCWQRMYLPLLRRVTPAEALLTGAEANRVAELRRIDPDDVPSATLALLLRAPFLSSDKPAVRAVYGPNADLRRRDDLLKLLRTVGDAALLRDALTAATLLPGATAYALMRGAGRAARSAPAALAASVLLTAWAGRRIQRDSWRRIGQAALDALGAAAQAATVYGQWQKILQDAMPAPPAWGEQATSPPGAVLTRAVMQTMAHSPKSQLSVAEIVAGLPPLAVAQSERPTRTVLQEHDPATFQTVYRGKWQLGRSAADHRLPSGG